MSNGRRLRRQRQKALKQGGKLATFTVNSPEYLQRLHELGRERYGAKWDQMVKGGADLASRGATIDREIDLS